jgi:hypothetical protein
VNFIAQSFAWPFRGQSHTRWAIGTLMVMFLPVAFIPLLGYAVAATRAGADPAPPPWRLGGRMLTDGFWVAIAILVLSAPFALLSVPLSSALGSPALWHSTGALLQVEARVSAALILALPWGIVMLLLMPHSTARFAHSGRPQDLFNFATTIRSVRRDFATWNIAIAAIVTAWVVGLASAAVFCLGLVPGIFYAILVSAHATASLQPQSAHPSAR